MSYTVLRGSFVIRYPDLPRQGPEPDGDTVKFVPDTPALVETLPRPSGRAPQINARGISVRLEAIDALETHFSETHQELKGANAARDALLAHLGFTGVTFFADSPNKVKSADQNSVRGHVLSNGIDANGRLIGFIYTGNPTMADGSAVFVGTALVDMSVNALLLEAGHAYPTFYATLPAGLRSHLAEKSRAARDNQPPRGLWTRDTANPDEAATIADLAALEQLVIWPKLFRRLVPYLAAGFTDFDDFDGWLRADPVNRDDELFLLTTLERGNMHDVIRGAGHQIQLTVWPENFIISPDPPPTSTRTSPQLGIAGDVLIVAVLPDPTGADQGNELATLLNISESSVDLAGWGLINVAGGRHNLGGTLASGTAVQIQLGRALQLGNRGDTIILVDSTGASIDRVTYQAEAVHTGRTICFGR